MGENGRYSNFFLITDYYSQFIFSAVVVAVYDHNLLHRVGCIGDERAHEIKYVFNVKSVNINV